MKTSSLKASELKLIKNLPLFSQVKSLKELNQILRFALRQSFEVGETLRSQGEAGEVIGIILEGEVEIFINGLHIEPLRMKSGDLVGELTFFTGNSYSGTAVACKRCELLIFESRSLKEFLKNNPKLGIKIYSGFNLRASETFIRCLSEKLIYLIAGDASKQVAHDIRSPLAALKTLASNLSGLSNEERELLNLVSDRISRIADAVLGKSLLEASKTRYQPTAIPNVISTTNLKTMIKTLFAEKRVRNKGRIQLKESILLNSDVLVRISPYDMERVLSNLLENSIQAIPQVGNIELHVSSKNKNIIFIIKDTGNGIPSEIVTRLATHRMTLGKKDGNGLGLLQIHQVVQDCRGKIKIRSKVGVGTQVTISLPTE